MTIVKPYADLSPTGRLRRLRGVATDALSQYDLGDVVVTYHAHETNVLYRMTTSSGARYMLRLASPGWRTREDLRSEAMWLDALARDTSIPVPVMMRALTGEQVLSMQSAGIPETWNVSLMTWVPGRDLGHYLSARNLEAMGRLFAEMHDHRAAWVPPPGFTTRRFEHWLSREEENKIISVARTTAGSSPTYRAMVGDAATRRLLERLHGRVEDAYEAIDRRDLRVIHCDLWHDNIKMHRGALHPLDFEDTVWGFRAHDIAMAMLDLLEVTGADRYVKLLAAFRRGYESCLGWPDDPIEPFQIGRMLWTVNWVARNHPAWLDRAIERRIPAFEHYEQTGKIIAPPPI